MGLFSRETECPQCGMPAARKLLTEVHPHPGAEARALCPTCTAREVSAAARRFGGRAVAIAPSKRFPAYFFASAARLLADAEWHDGFDYPDHFVERLAAWVPAEGATCERCSEPARFRWASLEILGGDPYGGWVDADGCFETQILCGGCVAERLQAHLGEEGIALGMVELPEDPAGIVWIPQEW